MHSGSAYQQVTDDSTNQYLCFFGQKVVSAVRVSPRHESSDLKADNGVGSG